MFHDGHQLNTVVASLFDARKHISCEFQVAVALGFDGGHPHVCFVNPETLRHVRTRCSETLEAKVCGVACIRGIPVDAIIGGAKLP
eukprot:Skav207813  [mRNA]  locus=scaffold381:418125:421710:- [translate_table: standard]